ncbi:hypothetical protein [Streptomyces indicus]|uniref:hypothetical protein n=1 Tax=Streptomyces indicus TaxID=417292 RepID=UPI001FE928DF|nr:hypothetical protein [Streptomyces indicus]
MGGGQRDVNTLTGLLEDLPPLAAYASAAILTESVLLVGAFVPTLTLLLSSGALRVRDIWTCPC